MRVVIAEDMVLLRAGMATLLADQGVQVVGEAGDAVELLALVGRMEPDAALIDIRMPPTHTTEGLDAALTIRAEHPGIAVLLLSSYLDVRYAARLLEPDPVGCGYLLKDRVAHPQVLADALHRVRAGECVLDPAVVTQLLNRSRSRDPLDDLSERERAVLDLMAQGHSNARIGALLHLSPRTVESHVRSIFTRLGLEESQDSSRRVLAVLAYIKG